MKVAGSVILYNSPFDCIEVIQSYWSQVEKLYVIDNSEKPNQELVEYLSTQKQVCYIPNNENKGVAFALNKAAELAVIDGYDYLLTMDDDTWAPTNLVSDMIHFLKNYTQWQQVGILAAAHTSTYSSERSFKRITFTMTSGNLLNLHIYKIVGPFRNDFFIDHVDHEYGLRLKTSGYDLIELPQIKLQHNLGEQKKAIMSILSFVSHSPIRGYYFVRNGLVLMRQYPVFALTCAWLITKELIKVMLFEDDRIVRIRYMWIGLEDAIRGKMGKFCS